MNTVERITVIGAGHGGKAMAAHLALKGARVTLFNRTPENVAAIKQRGGLMLDSYEGGPRGFAEIAYVTSDYHEAVRHAEVIMVVVPASAHRDVARRMAPHLHDGQIVVLHPGRTFGALEFHKVLRDSGCTAEVVIAEAQTFIYASRSEGPAAARIFRIKEAVPLAAFPARHTSLVLEALQPYYPEYVDGIDVLHTGLNNIGAIFHPAISLLNAGWIEATGGQFQFYLDGVTPAVARIMEALDRERVTIATALGVKAVTAREWLQMAYNAHGDDLREAIHNQVGYRGINAPATLNHRYVTEDVPMSLVPIAALGQRFGVSVRGMDSIIRLACIIHRTDYWRRGRTLEKLGIEHLSASELTTLVQEGDLELAYL